MLRAATRSVRHKLTLLMLAVTLAALVVTGIALVIYDLRAYREAWDALRAGVFGVVFPAGTYHLRVMHDVRCAEAA